MHRSVRSAIPCLGRWGRCLALGCLAVLPGSRAGAAPGRGVILESVKDNTGDQKAGLQPGDVIVSWRREASPPANPTEARGEIRWWFDYAEARTEEAPRGPFWLYGSRAGAPLALKVPAGRWGVELRPVWMPRDVEPFYAEGKRAFDAGDLEAAAVAWRKASARAEREEQWELASWLLYKIATAWRLKEKWSEAAAAYEASAAFAERHGLPLFAAWGWGQRSAALQKLNAFVDATTCMERSLALREKYAPGGLGIAADLNNLANFWNDRGDLAKAEEFLTRSLEALRRVVPVSHSTFVVLRNLSVIVSNRGDLDGAEALLREAMDLARTLKMGEVEEAHLLNSIGILERNRGDLPSAQRLLMHAQAILDRLEPEGSFLPAVLANLGMVAVDQGDLVEAEAWSRRCLTLQEKSLPGSRWVASALRSVGSVALSRGDLDAAESYYDRSLRIEEKLAPEGLGVADCLGNLGLIAKHRGQWALAEERYRKALALHRRLAPGGLMVADASTDLGELVHARHEPGQAETLLKQALEIQERVSPGSLGEARTLVALAGLSRDSHDPTAAEAHLARALRAAERLAPGSALEARCLAGLGELRRSGGRLDEAVDLLGRAVSALEAQRGRVGGSEETRAAFSGRHADTYRSYVEVLVEKGRPAEAFYALERSRARAFLAQLAERDIVMGPGTPAELERERRAADAAYDRAQGEIVKADLKDPARVDALVNELRARRIRQDEVATKIREASPHLAALRYPEPLDAPRAAAALDPGTVLLAYSVGPKKTLLFVVSSGAATPTPLAVHSIEVDREALRAAVQALRDGIVKEGGSGQAFHRQASRLFDMLIGPAQAEIGAAERIVICPDDQLHLLPFAALYQERKGRFLVQWKPLHLVASATAYARLRESRATRELPKGAFVGFGDPAYADRETADRLHLTPLPGARREIEELRKLFGDEASVYLGEAATEGRAKSVAQETRYLHFACHGFMDDRFPLNSGLALATPEQPSPDDNGLLQAWEIIERMRVRADLVVLSACETALGEEVAGEGLQGLARAFQYAGARSVLASLWSVPDGATRRLMGGVYGYLRRGYSKDAALRAAQLDLIEGRASARAPAFRQPLAWAAFQLFGDWQ